MSAFVVTEKTLNVIVNGVNREARDSWMPFRWRNCDPAALFVELLALNQQAVNGRYNENDEPPAYVHHWTDKVPRPALFKALSCLLYQCSEQPASGTVLYQELESATNGLAQAIVSDLPAYKDAPWDWPDQQTPAPPANRLQPDGGGEAL